MASPVPRDNRTSLQPARSYELPGGPYASGLGEVDVKVLAEIKRGSDEDRGVGSRR